ncbi:Dinitrogenase iron-molybdenum cofactor [Pelotomaculum schinkii]|uniref:Dinitrogenase iron-molybdenum cofactor n=1 Tax=Pelotomaculum schinkii TaxID=78350 RepID=A0A4Y7R7V9_9FIRM|nr:NifB/NifX family molybdenum-iron cluster-binding protein [Pelotomaculum schinkii]TEB05058.1 Dinitrogenase iron-molybdenum cofactor [Pelotomaculum schinkii]TEB14342.1 Dinitrogenase iron-molybdenum cofactor [Pelotomaculum sp. FP]
MKIAVTSQGKTLESKVDPRFGRAGWFVVIDTNTGDYKAVSNEQNLNANQGAGIQAAEQVSRQEVSALITGNCGPKAFRTLMAAGIKVYYGTDGTVAEVLEQFKKGKLSKASDANVDSHWV